MSPTELNQYLILLLIVLPFGLLLLQRIVYWLTYRSIGAAHKDTEVKLRPAELAFLSRDGDMSHTMVVLGFDLVHRALKPDNDGAEFAPYEQALWHRTREFVHHKVEAQVNKHVQPFTHPIQLVGKAMVVYKFLKTRVRQLVSQLMSDPRQLRRYFSPVGVGHFVKDLAATGTREVLQEQLTSYLTACKLLVPAGKRLIMSNWLLIIAVVGLIVFTDILWLLEPKYFLGILAMSLINALLLKAVLALRNVLPLYEELNLVLRCLPATKRLVKVCLFITGLVELVIVSGVVFLAAFLSADDLLIFTLVDAAKSVTLLAIVGMATLNWLVVITLAVKSYLLKTRPVLSPVGERLVAKERERMSSNNIVECFKDTLSTDEYDPKVSEMLAVYGYETLWLLT